MGEEKHLVEMTPEEKAAYEAYKLAQAEREAAENLIREKENYKSLVAESIESVFPTLKKVSEDLAAAKSEVIRTFTTAINIKTDLFGVKRDNQMSHTFTSPDGTKRITVGNYTTDAYADTVNEGISIVKEVIGSMARDEESRALVDAIMKLLSKDKSGNLKASRVIQLRQMAEKTNNPRLLEGVKLIEDSYQPTISKTYVKAERKNENSEWINIPLGMTEV